MTNWITATVDLAVAPSWLASFPVDYCHVMWNGAGEGRSSHNQTTVNCFVDRKSNCSLIEMWLETHLLSPVKPLTFKWPLRIQVHAILRGPEGFLRCVGPFHHLNSLRKTAYRTGKRRDLWPTARRFQRIDLFLLAGRAELRLIRVPGSWFWSSAADLLISYDLIKIPTTCRLVPAQQFAKMHCLVLINRM